MKNPYNIGTLTAVLGASLLSPVPGLKAEGKDALPGISSESKASRCYWLEAKLTDEGLCGDKLRPDVPLMIKEATQGNTFAAFRLGQLYAAGSWGTSRDIKASLKWFRVAAQGGHWPSQVKLGLMYQLGRDTKRDLKQALYWYKQATEQGLYPDLEDKILRLQEQLSVNQ